MVKQFIYMQEIKGGMANVKIYTFLEQNIVTFCRDVTVSKH
jgi:hypothetical protein